MAPVSSSLLEQAAKHAGIFPVTLVKESEAAALYTMHSLSFALAEGDVFVVCDVGGDTVDLISYEVAGSLGLNQRFIEAVRNLVGEDQFHDLRKTRGLSLAEKSFDSVKKAFRGKPDEQFIVTFQMASLQDEPEEGLKSNTWWMTG
ncbi:hypothetical protein B0I35DRAFT_483622 [Stachybotrys elegans]|uniref:Uncharacterized protein n=1 Tax=Stachybotrys elegans TaxID=80388 RepID=A0A8K0SH81_9HYPO|nr:hypothetical protein B0I35DRAFT_483622 [Stachybotrys elegans]